MFKYYNENIYNEEIINELNFIKSEYADIVNECLKSLYSLVEHIPQNNNSNELISKAFQCTWIENNSTRDTCIKCCGYLRLCGFDCSGELTEKDRDFDNNRKPYKLHLKPFSFDKDSDKKDLSLRIYFRWDENKNKIKIGYIGKHL